MATIPYVVPAREIVVPAETRTIEIPERRIAVPAETVQVPLPASAPTPEPGGFNRLWNVEGDENIVANVHRLWREGKPAIVGPSKAFDGVVIKEPFIVPKSRSLWAFARQSKWLYRPTKPQPMFQSATGEQTQTKIGFLCLDGPATLDCFAIRGWSNGGLLTNIEFRGWNDRIWLRPSTADQSAAFTLAIEDILDFGATGSLLKVESDPGAGKTLLHLTVRNVDGGRHNKAPMFDFIDLRDESSRIEFEGITADMAQGANSFDNVVRFTGCGRTPLVWQSGSIAGGTGKTIVAADSDVYLDISGVETANDPRPASTTYPAWQIKTPTVSLPGKANGGVISYRSPAKAA